MAVSKKHKQLLSRLKKREKNGIAKPVVSKPLAMKAGERNRFTNKNPMVLLAIEKTVLALAKEHVELDDRSVRDALVCSIKHQSAVKESNGVELATGSMAEDADHGSVAENRLARLLAENLKKRYCSFFPANNSQTIELWSDGLRAIYTSVCSVSAFSPGEKSYIDSVRQFLAKVQSS